MVGGDDFEREWLAIADKVRSVPGNVRQALARDPEDPDSFVVTSDWNTREEFSRFERSPEQDELTAPLHDLRASARCAQFLTPPKQHATEIRCYIRDPDGYVIEVGQTTLARGWRPPSWSHDYQSG